MAAARAGGTLSAVMQPYLFPYLGYFQLIDAVDTFVVLDDVDFIVRGWINRNAILYRGKRHRFTVPVERPGRGRKIHETRVVNEGRWLVKLGTMFDHAYHAAPFFAEVRPLLSEVFDCRRPTSIATLALDSIRLVCRYLGIETKIVPSARVYSNSDLPAAERLIDICRREGATALVNPVGGRALYSKKDFAEYGLGLSFLTMREIAYPQFGTRPFVPNLSIIDVLMFNGAEGTRALLGEYDLC